MPENTLLCSGEFEVHTGTLPPGVPSGFPNTCSFCGGSLVTEGKYVTCTRADCGRMRFVMSSAGKESE